MIHGIAQNDINFGIATGKIFIRCNLPLDRLQCCPNSRCQNVLVEDGGGVIYEGICPIWILRDNIENTESTIFRDFYSNFIDFLRCFCDPREMRFPTYFFLMGLGVLFSANQNKIPLISNLLINEVLGDLQGQTAVQYSEMVESQIAELSPAWWRNYLVDNKQWIRPVVWGWILSFFEVFLEAEAAHLIFPHKEEDLEPTFRRIEDFLRAKRGS